MKRSLTCLTCFLIAGAALISAGCSGSSSPEKRLIGSWEAEKEGMKIGMEFKEDKKMTMSMGPISLSGTWSLVKAEGDKMTIKVATEMPSIKMEGDETTTETKTEEQEFAIEFESNDRMKMAPTDDPSDSATFDRKKS